MFPGLPYGKVTLIMVTNNPQPLAETNWTYVSITVVKLVNILSVGKTDAIWDTTSASDAFTLKSFIFLFQSPWSFLLKESMYIDVVYVCKVDIWNVNCAWTTAFIFAILMETVSISPNRCFAQAFLNRLGIKHAINRVILPFSNKMSVISHWYASSFCFSYLALHKFCFSNSC